MAVIVGLVVGKTVGLLAGAFLATRLGLACSLRA
jgi:Na+/H+ antiporter NhaA